MRTVNDGVFTFCENGDIYINGKKNNGFVSRGKKKYKYNNKFYYFERKIYEAFNGVKLEHNEVIIHKDGDIKNCALDNLEVGLNCKFIQVRDVNTGIVYPSMRAAARALYVSYSFVNTHAKNKILGNRTGVEVEQV